MKRCLFVCVASIVAIALTGFVPGSANYFVNGSSNVIGIECHTVSKSYPGTFGMAVGSRLGISGDYSELTLLIVKYTGGKVIKLDKGDLERIKGASHLSRGVWWITDLGVSYISNRDANIQQRRLTGGRL